MLKQKADMVWSSLAVCIFCWLWRNEQIIVCTHPRCGKIPLILNCVSLKTGIDTIMLQHWELIHDLKAIVFRIRFELQMICLPLCRHSRENVSLSNYVSRSYLHCIFLFLITIYFFPHASTLSLFILKVQFRYRIIGINNWVFFKILILFYTYLHFLFSRRKYISCNGQKRLKINCTLTALILYPQDKAIR